MTAGIFDWSGPPSVVCRDSKSRPATAPLPPATPKPPDTASADPGTRITFSGEAYVGMAWAF